MALKPHLTRNVSAQHYADSDGVRRIQTVACLLSSIVTWSGLTLFLTVHKASHHLVSLLPILHVEKE